MAYSENQKCPLAPASVFKRSDEEGAPAAAAATWDKRRWPSIKEHRSSKCLVYILVWITLQAALALVLALVIFRVETPKFRVDNVVVQNLQFSNSSPSLNATLIAEVAIKNKNFGRFKFLNGTSIVVLYKGVAIGGKVPVLAASVKGRGTKKVNVTLEVRLGNLLLSPSAKNLTDDINSGTVTVISYARLMGKVNVMGIVRRRKTSEMNCTIPVHLSSHKVQELRCI